MPKRESTEKSTERRNARLENLTEAGHMPQNFQEANLEETKP